MHPRKNPTVSNKTGHVLVESTDHAKCRGCMGFFATVVNFNLTKVGFGFKIYYCIYCVLLISNLNVLDKSVVNREDLAKYPFSGIKHWVFIMIWCILLRTVNYHVRLWRLFVGEMREWDIHPCSFFNISNCRDRLTGGYYTWVFVFVFTILLHRNMFGLDWKEPDFFIRLLDTSYTLA